MAVIAADNDASVEMDFFGDIAKILLGQPCDVLLTKFLSRSDCMKLKTADLIG
jgi:hypothetical protein